MLHLNHCTCLIIVLNLSKLEISIICFIIALEYINEFCMEGLQECRRPNGELS